MKQFFTFLFVAGLVATSCSCGQKKAAAEEGIITGAERMELYLPLLEGKTVGILGNQTSIVGEGKTHLVDTLLSKGIDVRFAFAPEHGFRGDIERGEKVGNEIDEKTGLPIYTLYGRNERADSIVASVDYMIYDLQDVGARFYTYITSLDRLMQLCAANDTKLIVLDRPNPNGDQVDGPVRKSDEFKSGVSYHKIAMIHGLTVGELAEMINGEGWLKEGRRCDLTVIPMKNYTHGTLYELPVIPSPSLPNFLSVRLYTSLCLFEGTDINVGRGTDWPFQVVGYPNPIFGSFTFTPGAKPGMSSHVENQGQQCYGIDLRGVDPKEAKFTLKYLLDFYHKSQEIEGFVFFSRPEFFNKLAGNADLQEQIKAGMTEEQIRDSWKEELAEYKAMRAKYLLYEDFK